VHLIGFYAILALMMHGAMNVKKCNMLIITRLFIPAVQQPSSGHSLVQKYKTDLYSSESWTFTMEEERALAVFERKILRKIYGPVKENELWRIRRNDEL
jgi:hypothetical protein